MEEKTLEILLNKATLIRRELHESELIEMEDHCVKHLGYVELDISEEYEDDFSHCVYASVIFGSIVLLHHDVGYSDVIDPVRYRDGTIVFLETDGTNGGINDALQSLVTDVEIGYS